MRFTVLVGIFIPLAAAEITFKSCSYNEFCVDIRSCPMYKSYAGMGFHNWPSDLKNKAKSNLCNQEMIDQQRKLSVCCPSVMNGPTCGNQATDRISKGQVAKPFDFPWMALLAMASGEFVCGGTLISSRYVLTAAHCTKFDRIASVRLGENDITSDVDCIILEGEKDCAPPPQDIKVEKTIMHPQYSDRNKLNDIALLRLERPAVMGHSVRAICLPSGTREERALTPSPLVVSGWGLTETGASFDVLRFAPVPPVSIGDCAPKVQNIIAHVRLDESHVCAGGVDQVDNCAGDSGGPLQYVSNKTSKYIQYGIVAFGTKNCGIDSMPGVYTKVEYFISWIMEYVNE